MLHHLFEKKNTLNRVWLSIIAPVTLYTAVELLDNTEVTVATFSACRWYIERKLKKGKSKLASTRGKVSQVRRGMCRCPCDVKKAEALRGTTRSD